MASGSVIGALRVTLGLDSAEFEKGATRANNQQRAMERQFKDFGNRMLGLGAKLSLAVTSPMVLLAKKSVEGFVEQEKAMADVTAGLKSMGDASGKTAAELSKTADQLELHSLFDAEVILKQVTAQLLTFGNIAGQQFDRAQQAAVDMAAKLGQEPQAAAIMLGKALNDPIRGITALTKVGVTFTDGQRAQIKAMVAAGDTAKAQGIILDELAKEFGGAAQAAADATPWRQAQVAIGQAMDKIGEAVLPLIGPIADAIVSLVNAFNSLPAPVQKMVFIAAGLAAALGPVLMVVGGLTSAMAPLLAALAAAGVAMGPVILVVGALAAAGVLIYKNWDKIAPVLGQVWDTISTTLGPPLRQLVSAAADAFTELWNGPLGEAVRIVGGTLVELGKVLMDILGPVLLATLRGVIMMFTQVFTVIGDGAKVLSALFRGDLSGAFSAFWKMLNDMFGNIPQMVVDSTRRLYEGVKLWLQDRLGAVFDWVKGKLEAVGGWFFDLYDKVVGHSYIPDMVDGIATQMARLDAVMVDPASKAAKKTGDAMRALAGDVSSLLDRLFPASAALKQFREEWALLDRAQKGGLLSNDQADAARSALLHEGYSKENDAGPIIGGNVLDILKNFGGSFEDQLKRADAVFRQFADKAKIQTVQVAKSFKDMAEGVLQSLQGLTQSIKGGGFLDILSSVLNLAIQIGSIGGFGKKVAANINKPQVPAYASGTSFHPGGLAMVGEKGPELVSLPRGSSVYPSGTMPGGQQVVVVSASPLLTVEMDRRIANAAPAVMNGGAQVAQSRATYRRTRSLRYG